MDKVTDIECGSEITDAWVRFPLLAHNAGMATNGNGTQTLLLIHRPWEVIFLTWLKIFSFGEIRTHDL